MLFIYSYITTEALSTLAEGSFRMNMQEKEAKRRKYPFTANLLQKMLNYKKTYRYII